jgi:hypothetical protein
MIVIIKDITSLIFNKLGIILVSNLRFVYKKEETQDYINIKLI